jgi:hypothetical protein
LPLSLCTPIIPDLFREVMGLFILFSDAVHHRSYCLFCHCQYDLQTFCCEDWDKMLHKLCDGAALCNPCRSWTKRLYDILCCDMTSAIFSLCSSCGLFLRSSLCDTAVRTQYVLPITSPVSPHILYSTHSTSSLFTLLLLTLCQLQSHLQLSPCWATTS